MANGLNVDQTIKLFEGKPQEEQFAVIYELLHNQNCECQGRPVKCDDKYVPKVWLKGRILAVVAIILLLLVGGPEVFKYIPKLLILLGI